MFYRNCFNNNNQQLALSNSLRPMDEKNNLIIIFIMLIVSVLVMFTTCHIISKQQREIMRLQEQLEKTDTTYIEDNDTVWLEKTFVDSIPFPVYHSIEKHDTLYMEVGDSLQPVDVKLKKNIYSNSIVEGEDTVHYNAQVTGYDLEDEGFPTLDSISIMLNKKEITHSTTVIIEKPQKTSQFSVGFGIGAGYGLIKHDWDIYAGFSGVVRF